MYNNSNYSYLALFQECGDLAVVEKLPVGARDGLDLEVDKVEDGSKAVVGQGGVDLLGLRLHHSPTK